MAQVGPLRECPDIMDSASASGILRFSGSAAALVTLSISLAILNHVSLFTLSFKKSSCIIFLLWIPVRVDPQYSSKPDPHPSEKRDTEFKSTHIKVKSRIRVQIHIKMKNRIRVQIHIKVKSRIQIRIRTYQSENREL
jgi:hypothetical protein